MNSSVQYNDNNEAFDNKKQHPWQPLHTILKSIYTHKAHKVPIFSFKYYLVENLQQDKKLTIISYYFCHTLGQSIAKLLTSFSLG